MHLLIDAGLPSESARVRLKQVWRFLEEAPGLVGLNVILGPKVEPTPMGFAGFVIIAESHISVHVEGERLFIDAFSCRPFEERPVLDLAAKVFRAEWAHTRIIPRGLEYQQEMEAELLGLAKKE